MKNRVSEIIHKGTLITIAALAWPTMLEQLMQTAVQYIDTAMVGSLGTAAVAAVGSTTTVNWLIGSTVSALGIGFLSYIAKAIGAGKLENAKKAAAQALLCVILTGTLFTAVTLSLAKKIPVWMQTDIAVRDSASRYFFILYTPMLFRSSSIILGTVLRAAGDTKTPMRVGILVNIINVALNFLLIYPERELSVFGFSFKMFGAGMGVQGAAVASAAAFSAGGILIFLKLWNHKEISPKGRSLMPDGEILRPCFRVAFPNMLQRFCVSLGYVAFASMINSLGAVSAAAHTVANTVESAFYIPGYGMQTAAATLAGNAYGEGNREKLGRISKTVIPLEVCLMVFSGGLLFIFAPQLMRIFSSDTEVIALGSAVLRMVALSEPFYGVPIVIEGMMQGIGKTAAPFVFNVIGMWCIRILGTYICTQCLGLGLTAAWGCMIMHNMLLFVLFTVYYKTGKWLKER